MNIINNYGNSISALLPPSPSFCERDFALVLSEFYHRCSMYTPWEKAVNYDTDNCYFKLMTKLCDACAFVPELKFTDTEARIIWRPYTELTEIKNLIETIIPKEKRECFNYYAEYFLTQWIRHRFIIFKNKLINFNDNKKYRELMNFFFMGVNSNSFDNLLVYKIKKWLSVFKVNFSLYQYEINLKKIHGVNQFFISMNVIMENEINEIKKIPIFRCNDSEILNVPLALSNYLPEIGELKNNEFVKLQEEKLISFLDSAIIILKQLGIKINLPKSLANELKPRLIIKGSEDNKKDNQHKTLVSYLGLENLQKFEWKIAVGDETLTINEFNRLIEEKKEIISFKNGYIKIDPEELSILLKKANSEPPTVNDFLQAHFKGNSELAFDTEEKINNLFREKEIPLPANLIAELRPYQIRGFNWICSLLYSGFGCILADDMGLGKTIQSISVLLRLKEDGLIGCSLGSCLVIAPAALVNNWEKEFEKFAPSLKIKRYHGKGRNINNSYDVYLTTYQTTARDLYKLKNESFSVILADEAHLMKNTVTRISKAVKQLRAKYRIALSGTPVENRLEDLRSLFDFIMPRFLGDVKEFREKYRIPIEVKRNKEKAEELKKITSPFLLRRTKTDKSIINDLPEKIICNEYAVLEKDQAALYEIVVKNSEEKVKKTESKFRANIILSLLTSLKQICDHPRIYDKTSPPLAKLSGKAKLLIALLHEIIANGEKTLIFSQYVETLECLKIIIYKELKEDALLYHGGLDQETRAEIVNNFQNNQSNRIMLISLRAGGLGLNLTAASRVIHFDLWYNPAVENQATDRAFRIGQKRPVFVHRFITKNSFEEKVDEMISSKKELADMTIATGESWITKMSDEELRKLFER